jgi:hypothetical protein
VEAVKREAIYRVFGYPIAMGVVLSVTATKFDAGECTAIVVLAAFAFIYETLLSAHRGPKTGRTRTGVPHLVCCGVLLAALMRPAPQRTVHVDRSADEPELKFLARVADDLAR